MTSITGCKDTHLSAKAQNDSICHVAIIIT